VNILPGIGVMINALFGYDRAEDFQKALGKVITKIEFDESELVLWFGNDSLRIWDDGQSCCERRYLHTDDDLQYYVGSLFWDVNQTEAPNIEDQYDVHEVSFLQVKTSLGVFTIETHNEHNGYYGGFWVRGLYCEG